MDAETYSPADRSLFEQEKLKVKAVEGRSMLDEQPVRFYKRGELVMAEWRDVYLWADIPFNSKHDSETAKVVLC